MNPFEVKSSFCLFDDAPSYRFASGELSTNNSRKILLTIILRFYVQALLITLLKYDIYDINDQIFRKKMKLGFVTLVFRFHL